MEKMNPILASSIILQLFSDQLIMALTAIYITTTKYVCKIYDSNIQQTYKNIVVSQLKTIAQKPEQIEAQTNNEL